MSGALNWIGQLVEWFASLIPRLEICRANNAGIKYVKGKTVKVIGPGLYLYWPIVTEVVIDTTARQTINLETLTLTTSDDYTVSLSGVMVCYIQDIKLAIVDTDDWEDTVGDVALTSTADAVIRRTFTKCRQEIVGLENNGELTRACRKALKPFGIYVKSYTITDFAETTVYRVIGVPQEVRLA